MKPTLTNPHDKFFARIFSDKQNAVDFLRCYLPPQVLELMDLSSIEIAKDSFVDEELKAFLSDMLYRVRVAGSAAYVYLLFEHKSFPDSLIGFQLLKYMVGIWDLHLKQFGRKTLPLIIPLVIYHGVKKWKGGESFGRIVPCPHEALKAYVPDFKFLLHDLSGYTDEEIRGEVMLRVSLLVFKYVFRKELGEKLGAILALLGDLAEKKSGIEYLEVLIRYLAEGTAALSKEQLLKAISEIPRGDEIMPTIAQQWKEEGQREGKREGKREGLVFAQELLVGVLEDQFGTLPPGLPDKIGRIEDYEVLRMLGRRRKDCKTPADFERLLEGSTH